MAKHPFRVVELSQNYVTIIDTEDFRRVNKHSWHVHKSKGTTKKLGEPYARATIQGKKVYLHRFLMGANDPRDHVDHANQCTLDNRRSNLCVVKPADNMKNRRKRKPKKG